MKKTIARQGLAFGKIGALYQKVRMSYPEAVIKRIVKEPGLKKGEGRVLDIGAGTGKVTVAFAKRGFEVVALEPDKAMVAEARKVMKGMKVTYVVKTFEEAEMKPESFDMVACGSAFHWLDKRTRSRRIYDLLRPGGVAALMVNSWDNDYAFVRSWYTLRNAFKKAKGAQKEEGEVKQRKDLEKIFGATTVVAHKWAVKYSRQRIFDYGNTLSWVIGLTAEERAEYDAAMKKLLDGYAWPMKVGHVTKVILARKG